MKRYLEIAAILLGGMTRYNDIPNTKVLMTVLGGKIIHLLPELASETAMAPIGPTTWPSQPLQTRYALTCSIVGRKRAHPRLGHLVLLVSQESGEPEATQAAPPPRPGHSVTSF